MTNIILLDDLKEDLTILENSINSLELPIDYELISFQDERDLLEKLNTFPKYSIFILDIMLNETTGIEIANIIHEKCIGSTIIFITAYLDKLTGIVDSEFCTFIYKPELNFRIEKAMNKAIYISNQQKSYLNIEIKNKVYSIPANKILYIERKHRKCFIHTIDNVYEEYSNLEEYLSSLPESFIQCHKSFIINMNKVVEHKRTEFIMSNNSIIPISRTYTKKSRETYMKFLLNKH